MARTINIEVTGSGGQYEATIKSIQDRTNAFTRDAVRGAEQTAASFRVITQGLSTLQQQLLAVFSVGAITAFFKSALEGTAVLQDLSDQTGILGTNLAVLRQAGISSGQNIEDIATNVVKLQKTLIEAQRGGIEPANKGLQQLKLSAGQLTAALTDPNQLVTIFAQKLAEIPNQAERNAVAMDLAGKSGFRFAATLLDLAANAEKYRQMQVLTNEQIRAADELLDKSKQTWDALKGSVAAAVIEIGKYLGLIAQSKAEQLNDQLKKTGDALRIQTEHLTRLREAEAKGLIEPQHEAARRKEITETTKRVFDLLDAQEKLNAELKGEQTVAPKLPPSIAIDPQIAAKQAEAIEQAKTKLAQLTLASAEAARAQGDFTVDVRALAVAMIDQEKNAELLAAAHNKTLTPALRSLIEAQRTALIAQVDATEADKARARVVETAKIGLEAEADLAKETAEAWGFYAQFLERANQKQLEQIETQRQLGDLQADFVGILGKTTEAERLRLENQIRYLETLKQVEEAQGKDANALRVRDQQIINAQTQLQRLGSVTIDIGQHVGNTLNDIFTALITGTLKSVDIGKSALATVGRIATDIFQQAITKKLSFETTLFQNIQGIPGQATSALAAGAATLPGGQSSTGVGGFLQQIFGGAGVTAGGQGNGSSITGGLLNNLLELIGGSGRPPGVQGPLLPNGNFFSSGLMNLLSTGLGIGNSTIGGVLGAGFGGFGLAKLTGAGGLGQILSTVGSIGGNLLGGTAIGAGISSSVSGALSGVLGGSLAGLVGDFILPGLGSLLGLLFGQLFSHVPNPTVELQAKFSGIFYDALQDTFKPGTVTTNITKVQDISSSVAKQVKTDVQKILETLSKDWTDILNIFPTIVRESMIPGLDRANEILNTIFGRLKFTELGSHNIEEEIKLLQGVSGPHRFFFALRETIGLGIAESLKRAGLGEAAGLVPAAFTGLPDTVKSRQDAFKAAGLLPPKGDEGKNKEAIDAFITALKDFAGITGGLAKVSPGGVGQFLTAPDLAALNEQISSVLSITEGEQFTEGVNQLKERIKPVLDFLQQSLSDTANIFGRGLIAALEAATESDAKAAFLNNLGQGTKDLIFKGITDAFIASAQFNDLLAPIQQTIRQFTQEAIATGATPDIDAFRAAILPAIENISTRAETLAPLIAELQKLGLDVKNAIGLATTTTPSQTTININIDQFTGTEEDTRALARRLDDYLSGRLAPAS